MAKSKPKPKPAASLPASQQQVREGVHPHLKTYHRMTLMAGGLVKIERGEYTELTRDPLTGIRDEKLIAFPALTEPHNLHMYLWDLFKPVKLI